MIFTPAGQALTLSTAAFLFALAWTVAATWLLVPWLRRRGIGKTIRADGPDHATKSGTPTMGGLGMLGVVAVCGLVLLVLEKQALASGETSRAMINLVLCLSIAAVFALMGAIDDLAGIGKLGGGRGGGVGLSARRLFVAQILAAAFLVWVFRTPGAGAVWAVFGALVIVGTANGVNLADGLDGLAAGLLVAAFLGQATIIALLDTTPSLTLLLVCAAGAAAGFLVFNRYPAQVFMGNTASLGLGALLGASAVATGTWALLAVVAAVFAAEVISDIAQVAFFKISGGRRIFRMAPLHHHFEKGGWPEQTIVRRFWLAGALAAAAGVGLAAR